MSQASPAVEGWFTDGAEPALIGSACTTCPTVYFPPREAEGFCANPSCEGQSFEPKELSRRGTIWSYTDAQYQPPAPYIAASDPYEPFALIAAELPEGLVVIGQGAAGVTVDELEVGAEVEVVVERLYSDDEGDRTIWKWRPVS